MKKNDNNGFTLIELLVVIAIIGILASVVLASLSTARQKGVAVAIREEMANSRAQAAIYFDTNNRYNNVCDPGTNTVDSVWTDIKTKRAQPTALCNSDTLGWAMASPLPTTDPAYWCVDSTGTSRGTTVNGTPYAGLHSVANAALASATATVCN